MIDENKVSPWLLTPREADVMDAVVALGHQKGACRQLSLELKTVQLHCHNARRKIGDKSPLGPYLAWDRWRRTAQWR